MTDDRRGGNYIGDFGTYFVEYGTADMVKNPPGFRCESSFPPSAPLDRGKNDRYIPLEETRLAADYRSRRSEWHVAVGRLDVVYI